LRVNNRKITAEIQREVVVVTIKKLSAVILAAKEGKIESRKLRQKFESPGLNMIISKLRETFS